MKVTRRRFRRILVVRTDRIGDVILTTPLFSALRYAHPEAHITALVRPYTAPLLEGNDEIDQILIDSGQSWFTLSVELRAGNFDLGIVVLPTFRTVSAIWWAGLPNRLGPMSKWYSSLFNLRVWQHRSKGEQHESTYNLDLLSAIDGTRATLYPPKLALSDAELADGTRALEGLGLNSTKPWVVLHPGSGGSSARWKTEYFAELASRLADRDIQVLVTGGKEDRDILTHFRKDLSVFPQGPSLRSHLFFLEPGSVALRPFAAMIAQAGCFIGNSTGPLHIAAALHVPTVSFFTATPTCSARRWGPLGNNHKIFEFPPVGGDRGMLEQPSVTEALEACLAQL